jgi:hypothetical protein
MPKITLKKDGVILQIFRLEAKQLRVGSDRLADVKIDDWTVGREEALIWPQGNGFLIKGTGPFPQLVINGAEVSGERVLNEGDEIKIGPYLLVFDRLPEEKPGYVSEDSTQKLVSPVTFGESTERQAAPVKPDPEVEPATGKIPQAEPKAPQPAPFPSPPVREPSRRSARDAASEKTRIAAAPERTRVADAFEAPGGAEEFYLLAVWGPMAGRRFPLKPGETKIGRDKEANQIVVREDEQGELDTSVSRRHASFFWSNVFVPGGPPGPDFSIIDVGSKLGVMVNGRKIKAEKGVPLKIGDETGILSEKVPTIFRLCSGEHLDFAPPRFGKAPQKSPFFGQKIFWIIGGIIILLLLLTWILLK